MMKKRFKVQRVLFVFFVSLVLWGLCGSVLAQSPLKKEEIYQNLTGRCGKGQSLDREYCYQAQMIKSYVDVLYRKGLSSEDIYFKVAQKYSFGNILDEGIKEKMKQRFLQDAKMPKPYLALENLSIYLGKIEKSQKRVGGQIPIHNKGRAPLVMEQITTSSPSLKVSFEATEKGGEMILPPGQSGVLQMLINVESPLVPLGPFQETFTILSNDPYEPRMTVTVYATVEAGKPQKKEISVPHRDRGFSVPSRYYSPSNF